MATHTYNNFGITPPPAIAIPDDYEPVSPLVTQNQAGDIVFSVNEGDGAGGDIYIQQGAVTHTLRNRYVTPSVLPDYATFQDSLGRVCIDGDNNENTFTAELLAATPRAGRNAVPIYKVCFVSGTANDIRQSNAARSFIWMQINTRGSFSVSGVRAYLLGQTLSFTNAVRNETVAITLSDNRSLRDGGSGILTHFGMDITRAERQAVSALFLPLGQRITITRTIPS